MKQGESEGKEERGIALLPTVHHFISVYGVDFQCTAKSSPNVKELAKLVEGLVDL